MIYGSIQYNLDKKDYKELYQMNKDYINNHIDGKGEIPSIEDVIEAAEDKKDQLLETNIRKINFSKSSRIKKRTGELLKSYYNDGYNIFKTYYEAPSVYKFPGKKMVFENKIDFYQYIQGREERDIIKALPIIVHEVTHGYTVLMAYNKMKKNGMPAPEKNHALFYLNQQKSFLVPQTKVFNTSEMDDYIPEKLRTTRYWYVYPSDGLKSHIHGIYGLVDEWNAYYHGTKTAVRLYPYFKSKYDYPDKFLNYIRTVNNQYTAYVEFKFFILNYLLYAEQYYPEIFSNIMDNKKLMRVLLQIDENYKKQVSLYFERLDKICGFLQSEGIQGKKTENGIIVGSTSFNLYMNEYTLLRKELEKTKYKEIWHKIRKQANATVKSI